MDLGLGNLISVKRHLLPASLLTSTDYDAPIEDIALGVAALIGDTLNRDLKRTVNAQFECSADRNHLYLPRYPLETVGLVEMRGTVADGWQTLPNAVQNYDASTGMIWLGASFGSWFSRLRITYTGGYWYETEETETSVMPTGATKLPDPIRLAWLLQCAHIWASKDKLGVGMSTSPNKASDLTQLELIPMVKQLLQDYICYSIT